MSRENIGVAIGATGLAAFTAAVAAVMAGALDKLVTVAAPAVLLLSVTVGVVALVARGAGGGRGRPVAHSHGNRSRRLVLRHERAHRQALRLAGGGGSRMRVYRNGDGWAGRVTPHSSRRFNRLPRASRAAVYLAGGRAAPGTNCDHDNAAAAQILAGASGREREEAHRLADRWAR